MAKDTKETEAQLSKELDNIIQGILNDQESEILEAKLKEDNNTTITEENKEEINMTKNVKETKETKKTTTKNVAEEAKEESIMDNVKNVQNFRYFIVGKNGAVVSAAQVVGTNKVSMKEVTSGDTGHTFTLCLEEINRILEIIKEVKGNADFLKEPVQIRTLTGLTNTIESKNFLFWVRTGTYSDGRPVDERALKAWSNFIQLYGQLYADVVILGHKVSGKNNTADGKIQRTLLSKMFNELPKELALDIEFTK